MKKAVTAKSEGNECKPKPVPRWANTTQNASKRRSNPIYGIISFPLDRFNYPFCELLFLCIIQK